jgi:hypothetical protein
MNESNPRPVPNRWPGRHHGWIAFPLAILSDWLFWGRPAGWTVGLFGGVLLAAFLANLRWPTRRTRPGWILAALLLVLCLRCVYEPDALTIALLAAGIPTFALCRSEGWSSDLRVWLLRWSSLCLFGVVDALRYLLGGVGRCFEHGVIREGRRWIVPLALGLVFFLLFAAANPIIGHALRDAWQWIARGHFPGLTTPRVLTGLATALAILAVFCHRTEVPPGGAEAPAPQPSPSALSPLDANLVPASPLPVPLLTAGWLSHEIVFRALILFNVLFAVQTGLDLVYLWGGRALPEGVTYAEYAQRGAYLLVITALLAGAFALAAFRQSASRPRERRLVYLWLAQNVLLVVSSAWRLWLYVGAYSLTRWRVAAAVWMFLVALGLVWIAVRIAANRSNRWLVNINALTLAIVLFLCALAGADARIARFNVRHCEEVLGVGHPACDIGYLRTLGWESIPALRWLITAQPGHANRPIWEGSLRHLAGRLRANAAEWRGWSWRRARLLESLQTDLPPPPPPEPPLPVPAEDFASGSIISVGDDRVTIKQHDFVAGRFETITYLCDDTTQAGNFNSLADLHPDDFVILSYRNTKPLRTAKTIDWEVVDFDIDDLATKSRFPINLTAVGDDAYTLEVPRPRHFNSDLGLVDTHSPGRLVLRHNLYCGGEGEFEYTYGSDLMLIGTDHISSLLEGELVHVFYSPGETSRVLRKLTRQPPGREFP